MLQRPVQVGAGQYFPEMDGLRTVAITFVMIEHFGGLMAVPFSAGYYGVDLFFVISGFLITGILLRTSGAFGSDLKTFLGRRSLRIFPLYYLVLALLWVVDFKNTRSGFPWLATYTWNYYAAINKDENWLFYLWSLSVEEQFYLIWPLVVLSLRKHHQSLAVITVGVVAFGYAQLMYNVVPQISVFNYTGLPNRMGSLGLGAIGAIFFANAAAPQAFLGSRIVEVFTAAVLVMALVFKASVLQFPLMGVASLVIVLKCAYGEFGFGLFGKCLAHPAMVQVGRVSYCIYICHWPLGVAFSEHLFDPIWTTIEFSGPLEKLRWNSWVLKLPLVYGVSVGTALLSWQYFEKPLLDLKNRWFPTVHSPALATES